MEPGPVSERGRGSPGSGSPPWALTDASRDRMPSTGSSCGRPTSTRRDPAGLGHPLIPSAPFRSGPAEILSPAARPPRSFSQRSLDEPPSRRPLDPPPRSGSPPAPGPSAAAAGRRARRRRAPAHRPAVHAEPRRRRDGPHGRSRASTSTASPAAAGRSRTRSPPTRRWSVYGKPSRGQPALPLGDARGGRRPSPGRDANTQKIGDYFAACMDEARDREGRRRAAQAPISTRSPALKIDERAGRRSSAELHLRPRGTGAALRLRLRPGLRRRRRR